jgi:hypothetical protein
MAHFLYCIYDSNGAVAKMTSIDMTSDDNSKQWHVAKYGTINVSQSSLKVAILDSIKLVNVCEMTNVCLCVI